MSSVRPLIQQAIIYKYNINHMYVGPFILVIELTIPTQTWKL